MGWGYETCLLEDTEIPPKCHFVSYYYRSEVVEGHVSGIVGLLTSRPFQRYMTRKYQDTGSGLVGSGRVESYGHV